ncbi:steroidogenic acute regulatory protein, mitochondrial [Pelomyxa schiedti]|nr:steroidogenic acute regulatory protein, mitochondrial [Pelomyxa schiedti]
MSNNATSPEATTMSASEPAPTPSSATAAATPTMVSASAVVATTSASPTAPATTTATTTTSSSSSSAAAPPPIHPSAKPMESDDPLFEQLHAACADRSGAPMLNKLGVSVFVRQGVGGPNLVLGVGEIAATVDAVLPFVNQLDPRPKWDTFFAGGRVITDFGGETQSKIIHFWTKSTFAVWPRDCVIVMGTKPDGNGGYLVACRSIDDSIVPPTSAYVRANIPIAGFHVYPSPPSPGATSGTTTTLCYCLKIDVAGWIPNSIANLVNKYQPLGIIGVRKLVTGKSELTDPPTVPLKD